MGKAAASRQALEKWESKRGQFGRRVSLSFPLHQLPPRVSRSIKLNYATPMLPGQSATSRNQLQSLPAARVSCDGSVSVHWI